MQMTENDLWSDQCVCICTMLHYIQEKSWCFTAALEYDYDDDKDDGSFTLSHFFACACADSFLLPVYSICIC